MMVIDEEKYGHYSLDETNYEYHLIEVQNLDLLSSTRDEVKFAVDSALKRLRKLDKAWEFSHVVPGYPFQMPGEKVSWPMLFFKKPK